MNDLTPPQQLLADCMSAISEDVYHAGWLVDTEWILWRALLDWWDTGRAYWSPESRHPSDITSYMPRLDWLQREAGGWIWWLDGPTYVPESRWLRLVEHRAQVLAAGEDDNHRLDREVAR